MPLIGTEEDWMLACQPYVIRCVYDFCKAHPELDMEEVLGESQIIALRAVRGYDQSKGATVSTWVHRCVLWHLNSEYRSPAWVRRMSRQEFNSCEREPMQPRRFCLEWWMDNLSPRARVAVRLAMDGRKKMGLIRFLKERLRWEGELIDQVFQEIREAL